MERSLSSDDDACKFSLPLNRANLLEIENAQKVLGKTNVTPLPLFDRNPESFDGIICHVGVGAFHRSHQEMYTNALLLDHFFGASSGERWGVVGIGIRGSGTRDALARQDYLYSVLLRDDETTSVTVVGSLVDFVMSRDKEKDETEGERMLEYLASPRTRIISLTLTEKGYHLDLATGNLDLISPAVLHDLASADSTRAETPVGTLAKALARRRAQGTGGCTILSCDNLPGNGRLARDMVLGFLRAAGDTELVKWVEERCSFPGTMVDRITPVTKPLAAASASEPVRRRECNDYYSDLVRASVCAEACLKDIWPISAETFHQWVIEDDFVAGRPRWEDAGALFVSDVGPYEVMKLRLLNAGHSALSYPALLLGHQYVDCALESPCLKAFLNLVLSEQAATVTPAPAGVDLEAYQATLLKRFANPHSKDELIRLAEDGSLKLATTLRDAALENARAGRPVAGFACVVACWARFLLGVDERGKDLHVEDPRATELAALARPMFGAPDEASPLWAEEPLDSALCAAFLRAAFGDKLSNEEAIVLAVLQAVKTMARKSIRGLLDEFLSSNGRECGLCEKE